METDTYLLQKKASTQALLEALRTYNVYNFKDYLKTWQKKSYEKFNQMSYPMQKYIMCKCIVDNKNYLDKELVRRAKDFIRVKGKRYIIEDEGDE